MVAGVVVGVGLGDEVEAVEADGRSAIPGDVLSVLCALALQREHSALSTPVTFILSQRAAASNTESDVGEGRCGLWTVGCGLQAGDVREQ